MTIGVNIPASSFSPSTWKGELRSIVTPNDSGSPRSIEEIALAKKEILEGTKAQGIAIFNWDDPWIRKIATDWKGDKLRFGSSSECDVRALNIQQTGWEGLSFELGYGQKLKKIHFPFFYESYLYNFLAAATISYALSVPLADILTQVKTLKPFSMRGTVITLKRNIKLIDDSYNSNPKDILVAIGPSIAAHHYEIGPEVVEQVEATFGLDTEFILDYGGDSPHLDLWKANKLLLERVGVRLIENSGICTACNLEDWYSHRGESGKTGRFGALITLSDL